LYSNVGLLVILFIFWLEWRQGKPLEVAKSVSMLAMIFSVFFQVNAATFWCLTNLQQFFAVLQRLADVFAMEETKKDNQGEVCAMEEVCVKFENASFSWGYKVKDT
jgi:ABC-type transport system involved in cytochrome bd biosynthesis fused ATPase/permease subunit